MSRLRVVVARVVDGEWPGWAEVHLREADGGVATMVEKAPALSATELPAPGGELWIDREVRDRFEDGTLLVVLGHTVQDTAGRATFRVRANGLSAR